MATDSSHNDVTLDDVVDDVFIDSEMVVVQEGEYDLDVGQVGRARFRTAATSTRTLELAYLQPGSPLSPYDVQPIFVIQTHVGMFAFSTRGVPQPIQDMVLDMSTTLQPPAPISFRAMPLGANLLGSISTIERPQAQVVIDDPTGYWAQRLSVMALITLPAGLFWLIRGLYTQPALTGTIGRITYTNRQMLIDYGFYKRHFWGFVT